MANELGMAEQGAVLGLLAQGWSQRRVARALGLHRDTVRRYARQGAVCDPKGKSKTPGPSPGRGGARGEEVPSRTGPEADPKQATPGEVAPGSGAVADPAAGPELGAAATGAGSRSQCEPFAALIQTKLEQGLTAQRIYQDLVSGHGFSGAYNSVKRYVRRLGRAQELPFRRLECAPGAEAQIDFGCGAPLSLPDGRRRRTHVLRLVLSHSRKGFSEVFYRQTTDNLLACCENAFWAWGGVPQTLVIDNLKAAVRRADWYDPELHPKLRAFCRHYGTVLLPTRVRTPRHKGKIESGINYVQSNALRGRSFESLAAENTHLAAWEHGVADLRIHGTTKRQVRRVFEAQEVGALGPLPSARFPFFHEAQRRVHRDGHIEVDQAYYSVPPEYLGRTVWVRWDAHLVRVFNPQFAEIALHARQEPGRFRTAPHHLAARKMALVEQGATELLRRARLLGPQTGRWAEAMLKARGIEGVRVLVGLLSLARKHSGQVLEQACAQAAGAGSYRLRELRARLQTAVVEGEFEFLAEHPVIRPLSAYGVLVQVSFTGAWREPPVAPPDLGACALEGPRP